MLLSIRLVKHRVQRSTIIIIVMMIIIKSTGFEKRFTNIDYPLMLTVNPVYVLHAFLRNISEILLKCLLTNKRRETE